MLNDEFTWVKSLGCVKSVLCPILYESKAVLLNEEADTSDEAVFYLDTQDLAELFTLWQCLSYISLTYRQSPIFFIVY